MNIIKLYQDYNIQFSEAGQSSNASVGWVMINCPFCDDPSDHLGYNLENNYFNCWRCGFHDPYTTIAKLLSVYKSEATSIVDKYGGIKTWHHPTHTKENHDIKIKKHRLKLPPGTTSLTLRHKKYLTERGFDPDKLEQEWELMGTGPIAPLKTGDREIDYRHRILAPIYWGGELVSFQTRDITDRHSRKYLVCPKERELVHHKNILYGKQEAWKDRFGICVEGITDVWRFGPIAFATFGIEYTEAQIKEIHRHFKKVVVAFDPEQQAQKQATKLTMELRFRGIHVQHIIINKDPGSMPQEEADRLVRQLRKDAFVKGEIR